MKLHWRPSPRAEGRGAVGRKAARPAVVSAAALALFLLGAGLQYSLAVWLGAYTTLSRDAVNGISFGMEGVWFLLAGFALSFLGRGYRPLENLIASAVFGAVTFFLLRALKPPSGFLRVTTLDFLPPMLTSIVLPAKYWIKLSRASARLPLPRMMAITLSR